MTTSMGLPAPLMGLFNLFQFGSIGGFEQTIAEIVQGMYYEGYANAILHYTGYTDVIAIGMTGHKNASGKIEHKIGVYYVSKSNFGIGQKVDDYTDFSFLKKREF